MIGTSLAAAIALLAPSPENLLPQEVPYYASAPAAPVSNQPRTLNDQDTALFRQGLAAARARDVSGARAAMAQISDPAARKRIEHSAILQRFAETIRAMAAETLAAKPA